MKSIMYGQKQYFELILFYEIHNLLQLSASIYFDILMLNPLFVIFVWEKKDKKE